MLQFSAFRNLIKHVALHESQRGKMEKLIAAICPDFKVPANARFVVEDEKQFPGFNPLYLFREGLALITPLLWLLFALNLMGYFFLLSWTPTLLTAAKLPPTTAALAGPRCRSEVPSAPWYYAGGSNGTVFSLSQSCS